MRKCNDMERAMAAQSQMFVHGGIFRIDWFSERLKIEGKLNDLRKFILKIFEGITLISSLLKDNLLFGYSFSNN
jgi:hypothetical protein